jgi:hypothetical protein
MTTAIATWPAGELRRANLAPYNRQTGISGRIGTAGHMDAVAAPGSCFEISE